VEPRKGKTANSAIAMIAGVFSEIITGKCPKVSTNSARQGINSGRKTMNVRVAVKNWVRLTEKLFVLHV